MYMSLEARTDGNGEVEKELKPVGVGGKGEWGCVVLCCVCDRNDMRKTVWWWWW